MGAQPLERWRSIKSKPRWSDDTFETYMKSKDIVKPIQQLYNTRVQSFFLVNILRNISCCRLRTFPILCWQALLWIHSFNIKEIQIQTPIFKIKTPKSKIQNPKSKVEKNQETKSKTTFLGQ